MLRDELGMNRALKVSQERELAVDLKKVQQGTQVQQKICSKKLSDLAGCEKEQGRLDAHTGSLRARVSQP
jgi:hypothetical protein